MLCGEFVSSGCNASQGGVVISQLCCEYDRWPETVCSCVAGRSEVDTSLCLHKILGIVLS